MSTREIIDATLLKTFIANFWGYGTFDAPIWMIGMEESCGTEDLPPRIGAWNRRGQKALEDAPSYHRDFGAFKSFQVGAAIQRTWSKLIKTYLEAYDFKTDRAETRRFQTEILGRSNPVEIPTCFLELMPLPSPSTKKWLIGHHTDIPYLKTRSSYFDRVAPDRVNGLTNLISEFKPKAVLFFGTGYRTKWEEISGPLARHPDHDNLLHTSVNGTTFMALPHPVAHGVKNAHFITAGSLMKKIITA